LGSTRVVVDSLGTIVQQADYLPYGEKCVNSTLISGENDYLYCGKEFQAPVFNIPWYDSQARFQTTDGIFVSLDPLCEKYYSLSPYAYCAGNPVRYVDRDGDDWRDVVNGFSSAVRTNLSPASPTEAISPAVSNASHYAIGHYLGNAATIVLGAQMMSSGAASVATGASMATAGVAAAPETAGASLAVSAVGVGTAAAGAAVAVKGARMFMNGVKGAVEDVSDTVHSTKNSGETHPNNPSRMQSDVEKGRAPKSIDRVDKGNPDLYEQDHIHFKDGSALNKDGSWKHGNHILTRKEIRYVEKNGWKIPE
jgi:RHS repeat-associated protein